MKPARLACVSCSNLGVDHSRETRLRGSLSCCAGRFDSGLSIASLTGLCDFEVPVSFTYRISAITPIARAPITAAEPGSVPVYAADPADEEVDAAAVWVALVVAEAVGKVKRTRLETRLFHILYVLTRCCGGGGSGARW